MSAEETLRKELAELSSVVHTLAKAVLAKAEDEEEEDEKVEKAGMGMYNKHDDPMMSGGDELGGDPMMDEPGMGEPGMGDDLGMEDDMYNEDEEPEMALAYKQLKRARANFARVKKQRQANKGYAGAAQVKRDEHDAPFGDKDSSLKGNQPQPAGEQGGQREDETFGPGGEASRAYAGGTHKQLIKQVQDLTAQVEQLTNGQVIAKSIVPARPGADSGEEPILTREMQEQAKGATFKQLNALRIQVGDLNPHVFGSR